MNRCSTARSQWGILGSDLNSFPELIEKCAEKARWKEKWKGWRTPVAVERADETRDRDRHRDAPHLLLAVLCHCENESGRNGQCPVHGRGDRPGLWRPPFLRSSRRPWDSGMRMSTRPLRIRRRPPPRGETWRAAERRVPSIRRDWPRRT